MALSPPAGEPLRPGCMGCVWMPQKSRVCCSGYFLTWCGGRHLHRAHDVEGPTTRHFFQTSYWAELDCDDCTLQFIDCMSSMAVLTPPPRNGKPLNKKKREKYYQCGRVPWFSTNPVSISYSFTESTDLWGWGNTTEEPKRLQLWLHSVDFPGCDDMHGTGLDVDGERPSLPPHICC